MNAELFLKKVNSFLLDFEHTLIKDIEPIEVPNIFVMGLPRSGTTLISQVLFNSMDIAVVNNVHAKFWEAPITGAYISKLSVELEKNVDYSSFYGRTNGAASPHEFSYFWKERLKINELYNSKELQTELIDWNSLKDDVGRMNLIFEKSCLFKTMEYTGLYYNEFKRVFPKSIFVFISRDDLEVACSIYLARKKMNVIDNDWWGSVPLDIYDSNFCCVEERIVCQVLGLKKLYNKIMIDSEVLKVDYHDFCSNPVQFMKKIESKTNIKLTMEDIGLKLDSIRGNYKVETKVERRLRFWFKEYL